jgi:predicted TIM-barrel fold metal-dependent hydrolase
MIIDCHVHSLGNETADEIVKELDRVGIDKAVVFATYPGRGEKSEPVKYMEFSCREVNDALQKESTKFVSKLQADAPDRIIAFAWIEPRLKNATKNIEEAVTKYECKGIKMMPDHYYPYEPMFFPVYKKVEELEVPITFHSGILGDMKDSSRFCQPAFYEVLINFPNLKFALAHVSWPWIDECVGICGRLKSRLWNVKEEEKADKMQMYIDITPGTPKFYRKIAFQRILDMDLEDYVIFGTDCPASNFSPWWQDAREVYNRDKALIKELGYSDEVVEKIFHKNAERYLKL